MACCKISLVFYLFHSSSPALTHYCTAYCNMVFIISRRLFIEIGVIRKAHIMYQQWEYVAEPETYRDHANDLFCYPVMSTRNWNNEIAGELDSMI